MDKAHYVFIVYDDMAVPHFAKTKYELIQQISQCRNPRVITYSKEEDALLVVRVYQKKHTGQFTPAPVTAVDTVTATATATASVSGSQFNLLGVPKRQKPAEDDDNDRVVPTFASNSAEKTYSSGNNKVYRTKNFDIYAKFKENEQAFAAAKGSLNPSDDFVVFFDGGSRGNPGNAGSGYAIYTAKNQKVYTNFVNIGVGTNNKAEYCGMIYGMKSAVDLGIKKIEIRGDSELVIKQMKGEYRVKNEWLKPLHQEASKLEKMFDKVTYNWIPRVDNSEADALSNQAMDAR